MNPRIPPLEPPYSCARCGCEYEWGVLVAFFAQRAGFTARAASVALEPGAPCFADHAPKDAA